ncbi:MAG: FAD-binding oxidoreductase [Acetobacteraceae bacterium]|nr:FAD-binding oxidoreductase [Acetobacteraceae bacterium]
MGPPVDPVTSEDTVPARTGVVVIGGGIVGTCAALTLAQRGVAVTLCEKGDIAGEQSSRNWGWVRKNGRDEREIPLIMESLRQWERMNETIGAETGFRTCGVMSVARNADERAKHEAWLDKARPYQIGSRIIEGEELEALMPGATQRYVSALYNATDGRAEPQKAAPAIALAARRLGAHVLTRCAVRGLDLAGGRVSGVVTERGRIACDGVVLAGGAWSRLFCGSLGVDLPQLKVLSTCARTAPIEGLPETSAWVGNFAYRKRLDGGYNIADGTATVVPIVPDTIRLMPSFLPLARAAKRSVHLRVNGRLMAEARTPKRWKLDARSPFEEIRVLDPRPDGARNRRAVARMQALYPAASGLQIVQQWAGLIDVTPDAVPVISTTETVPGLVIATGFSGHGFGIGPAAGRLAADLATGAPPVVDPVPFRLSRFHDGSKIVVDVGI